MDNTRQLASDHRRGFSEAIQQAAEQGRDHFFNWFDRAAGDTDSAFVKGQCEFGYYVLLPLLGLLSETRSKTALEIGYGGGRLLAAAAPLFKNVIGTDVHDSEKIVIDELRKRGIQNVQLFQTDGTCLPVPNESVDLVYSFIVLQHIARMAVFRNYLRETWRVLVNDGYAVLFFGRLSLLSRNTSSKLLFAFDNCIEKLWLRSFREVSADVNDTNLRISLPYAKRLAIQHGFKVISSGASRKLPCVDKYGGQSFLVLSKKS